MIEISSSTASSSTSVTEVQTIDKDKTIEKLTPEEKNADEILEKVEDNVKKPDNPEDSQEEDELIGSSQESFIEDNR